MTESAERKLENVRRREFEESVRFFPGSDIPIWGHDELNNLIAAARDVGRSEALNDFASDITAWGKEKGWDEPLCMARATATEQPQDPQTYTVLAKLALVVSELAEAIEAARERQYILHLTEGGKPDGFVVEIADAMIRQLHICGQLGLDIGGAFAAKLRYNQSRPFRHGGKAA